MFHYLLSSGVALLRLAGPEKLPVCPEADKRLEQPEQFLE
jgi:hypothetical protein